MVHCISGSLIDILDLENPSGLSHFFKGLMEFLKFSWNHGISTFSTLGNLSNLIKSGNIIKSGYLIKSGNFIKSGNLIKSGILSNQLSYQIRQSYQVRHLIKSVGMHESGFFDLGESLSILWYWYNFQFGYKSGICTRYLNSGEFMIDKHKEEKKKEKVKFSIEHSILIQKFMKIS